MRPSRRAESRPAFVRSRSMALSNSANAPTICIIILPAGVVVSIASVKLRNWPKSNARLPKPSERHGGGQSSRPPTAYRVWRGIFGKPGNGATASKPLSRPCRSAASSSPRRPARMFRNRQQRSRRSASLDQAIQRGRDRCRYRARRDLPAYGADDRRASMEYSSTGPSASAGSFGRLLRQGSPERMAADFKLLGDLNSRIFPGMQQRACFLQVGFV